MQELEVVLVRKKYEKRLKRVRRKITEDFSEDLQMKKLMIFQKMGGFYDDFFIPLLTYKPHRTAVVKHSLFQTTHFDPLPGEDGVTLNNFESSEHSKNPHLQVDS